MFLMLLLVGMSKTPVSSAWLRTVSFSLENRILLSLSKRTNPLFSYGSRNRIERALLSAHSWGHQWWLHNLLKATPLMKATFMLEAPHSGHRTSYWSYLWEQFDFVRVGTVGKESPMPLCSNGEWYHLLAEHPNAYQSIITHTLQ